MTEQRFTVGQRVQDRRAGSLGLVVYTSDQIIRVRWSTGDESCFIRPAAEEWLRVVAYDLAELRKEERP